MQTGLTSPFRGRLFWESTLARRNINLCHLITMQNQSQPLLGATPEGRDDAPSQLWGPREVPEFESEEEEWMDEDEENHGVPMLSQATSIVARCWATGQVDPLKAGVVCKAVAVERKQKPKKLSLTRANGKASRGRKKKSQKVTKKPKLFVPRNFQGFPLKYCEYVNAEVGCIFVPSLRKGAEKNYGESWKDARSGKSIHFDSKHFCKDCLLLPCVMVEKHSVIYGLVDQARTNGEDDATINGRLRKLMMDQVLPGIFNRTYVRKFGMPTCASKWINQHFRVPGYESECEASEDDDDGLSDDDVPLTSLIDEKKEVLTFSQMYDLGNQLLEEEDSDLEETF